MCMGKTHAAGAAAAGLAFAEFAGHLPLLGALTVAGLTAGMGVLPDADHPDATIAHCFGFLTKGFAWLVGKIAGGHRWGSHSILGVAIFTAIAWGGVEFRHDWAGRIVLCALLSLAIAAGLYVMKIRGHIADALAIGTAIFMTVTGTGLAYVALATAIGCSAHLVMDAWTDLGCPFGYPFSRHRYHIPEPLAFTTDSLPERVVVYPACLVSLALLAALAIDPASGPLAWHAVLHYV